MKIIIIGLGVAVATVVALANELGRFAEEINPYGPEDYPRNDAGDDF